MKYQFVFLEESGNGSDFIIAIERRPGSWERLAGGRPELLEYFGPRPHWITMDGLIASPKIERILN